jgi:hypothetical protein
MAHDDGGGETMTRERMAAILASYGAAPSRWPEAERDTARAWAAAHPQDFAALSDTEAALDATLDLDTGAHHGDTVLAERILAARADGVVVRPTFGRARGPMAQLAALAACAVLGLAIGFAAAPTRDDVAGDLDAAFGAAFDLPVSGGAGG